MHRDAITIHPNKSSSTSVIISQGYMTEIGIASSNGRHIFRDFNAYWKIVLQKNRSSTHYNWWYVAVLTATQVLLWAAFSILPQKLGHPNPLPQDWILLDSCLPQLVNLDAFLSLSDGTCKNTPPHRHSVFPMDAHFLPSTGHMLANR